MKAKLFLIFIIGVSPMYSYAQSYTKWHNWQIDDKKQVIWQEVVTDSTLTIQDITNYLKGLAWCREIEQRENSVYAKAVDYRIDYKKYKSYMSVPVIYSSGVWTFGIVIDYKPGKYRITISTVAYDAGSVSGGGFDFPVTGRFEEVVLKKDRLTFKDGQTQYMAMFASDLKTNFTIQKSTRASDW